MDNSEKIKAVSRMQKYIDNNLTNKITLNDLSNVSGYSKWYSAKMFKELTNKNPFEYIRALRLSKAAIILRDNKTKVIDVAFDFVFDSHEGFTRAFSKRFGIAPKKYSDTTPPIYLFMSYPIEDYYKLKNRGNNMTKKKYQTVFTQVIERPKRKLILKRGIKAENYYEYMEEVDCDTWGLLCSIKEALYEPCGLWLPNKLITKGTSKYVQGVEVPFDYQGEVPVGFDLIDLPECKMMVFQGEPFNDEDFEAVISDIWEVIDKYNPNLYGFEWDDDMRLRFQLEPQGYRGYIEARSVKQINI